VSNKLNKSNLNGQDISKKLNLNRSNLNGQDFSKKLNSNKTNLSNQVVLNNSDSIGKIQKNSNISVNILDSMIYINNSLLNKFNNDEEFKNFLVLYSQLSKSMTYFWYIVYRSLYFFIDKTGKTKVINNFFNNIK
jgi:hypothetical protein